MQASAGRVRRLIEGGRLPGGAGRPGGPARRCVGALVAALSGRLLEAAAPDRGKEFANNAEASARLGGAQSYLSQAHRP